MAFEVQSCNAEANRCADFLAKAADQVHTRWKNWNEPPVQLDTLLLGDTLMDPP